MIFFKKQKGSSLVISLGLMSLLLILSGGIMTTIFRSTHLTNNVANANKSYFAAESGLEEALYELSNHLSGFETQTGANLTNNAKYDYKIDYKNITGRIPPSNQGNSPTDSNWNKITYKGSYSLNLFYDKSTYGNQTKYDCSVDCSNIVNPLDNGLSQLDLYIRTPDSQVLPSNDVFIIWGITGLSKSYPNLKYTLLPITDKADSNYSEITGSKINNSNLVLNISTNGTDLEGTPTPISTFLNNPDLHLPQLKISVVSELKDSFGNPFPYLEFYIEANETLPDSFATITSAGYTGMTKQKIQTKVKQEGSLSLFDYAIFQ